MAAYFCHILQVSAHNHPTHALGGPFEFWSFFLEPVPQSVIFYHASCLRGVQSIEFCNVSCLWGARSAVFYNVSCLGGAQSLNSGNLRATILNTLCKTRFCKSYASSTRTMQHNARSQTKHRKTNLCRAKSRPAKQRTTLRITRHHDKVTQSRLHQSKAQIRTQAGNQVRKEIQQARNRPVTLTV